MTSKPIKFKYNEDKSIEAFSKYVEATYNQHYVGDGDVQTIDFWRSLGSLDTTARDTAIKYLSRYGKKAGKNRKDLLKTMHYVILMMYVLDLEEQKNENEYGLTLEHYDDSVRDAIIDTVNRGKL
jgi:hypothetical protein